MRNVLIILASAIALAFGNTTLIAKAQTASEQTDGLIIELENCDIQKWAFQNSKLYILLTDDGKARLDEVTSGNIGETLTIKWRTHTIVSVSISSPVSSGRIASADPSQALLNDLESQIETQIE